MHAVRLRSFALALVVAAVPLVGCEMLVQLDRSAAPEVDAGCAICSEAGAFEDAAGDGGAQPSAGGLSLVSLIPWDGGADAGCTIASTGTHVGCVVAYEISGDPSSCAGFDGTGSGSTTTCQTICKSGLTCELSGLSNRTDVVACEATCGSPEH